jgi:hypothetical protein
MAFLRTSDRNLQRDFLERHLRHFHLTAATRTAGDSHQALPLKDPDIILDVFEIMPSSWPVRRSSLVGGF